MSKLHVYLKPFLDDTGAAYAADWLEVTDDVTALGNLTQALDNTEYDVGVFRASSLKLSLLNHTGKYSQVGNIESIFRFTRASSLVRVTWEPGDHPLIAGFFTAGDPDAIVSTEVAVFEGLLSDIATQSKIEDADVEFSVLGFESLLAEMVVPVDTLDADELRGVIFKCVNQTPFNELVTLDPANFSAGSFESDQNIDSSDSLVGKTVLEAARSILLAANAVFYIRDGVAFMGPRTAGTDIAFTFRGPGSLEGIENIVGIEKYRSGENRVFNYWTWRSAPSVLAEDLASIDRYRVQKKEINLDVIEQGPKQQAILDELLAEFSLPKRELELECFITPETLAIFLLDRISIDYPSVALPPTDGHTPAQYEVSNWDEDYYAEELLPLTIASADRWKVMARVIDFKKETMKLSLREA